MGAQADLTHLGCTCQKVRFLMLLLIYFSDVVLDPVLAEILLHKSEGDRSTLKWDDVFSR